ncbi:MAG: ABC transporter permease [Pseudomonadales bacterium]
MQNIPLSNLLFIFLPALLTVFIVWRWTDNARTSLHALARMVIQLILIGYALSYIFLSEQVFLVCSVLGVMLVAAAWISLRPVDRSLRLFSEALLSIFVVNACLLFVISAGVLTIDPWFKPSILIPLAGMVFASGMNSVSLFVERYYAELSSGAELQFARNAAFNATMIPTINGLFAVGLVSLPGMMTGQILSGVSPLIAVRYQIMIMLMLFSSAGLTVALFHTLLTRR